METITGKLVQAAEKGAKAIMDDVDKRCGFRPGESRAWYSVGVEVLQSHRWVELDEALNGVQVDAARLVDSDGMHSLMCLTAAEMDRAACHWIGVNQLP